MNLPKAVRKLGFWVGASATITTILVVAILFFGSGSGGGVASAANPDGNIALPKPSSEFALSGFSRGSSVAIRRTGGYPLIRKVAVARVQHTNLVHFSSLQPHLVQSFPILYTGYVRTTAFVPNTETAKQDSSSALVPYVLAGSMAAWSFAAITGAFSDSPGHVPGRNPPGLNNPGSNNPAGDNPGNGNPPGINPPGGNPGIDPPGNGPDGNGPPGNGPDGNGPPGNGPGGNGPPGNGPDGNGPPGNGPDGNGPPGNGPSGPEGNGPDGNGPPGNPGGGPNGDDPTIPELVTVDDSIASTVTPEPMSMILVGSGLAGLAAIRKRRRK